MISGATLRMTGEGGETVRKMGGGDLGEKIRKRKGKRGGGGEMKEKKKEKMRKKKEKEDRGIKNQ